MILLVPDTNTRVYPRSGLEADHKAYHVVFTTGLMNLESEAVPGGEC